MPAFHMTTPSTNSKIKRICGSAVGLPWLGEIASVYSGSALRMDWHAHDDDEAIFCLKGEMVYEFRHHRPITLYGGQYFVIPARLRHRLASGIDSPSRRVSFLFKNEYVKRSKFAVFTDSDYAYLKNKLLVGHLITRRCPPGMTEMIARLGEFLHRDKQLLSSIEMGEIRALTCLILIHCARNDKPALGKSGVRLMDEAIAWFEKHYTEKVDLQELINHIGYGRTRFFHLFKQKAGVSPNDFLIRLRVKKAKELLTSTEATIKNIADKVGFTDTAFFTRTFRRIVGISPSDYRKANSN